jgi:hypothetical protein
MGMEIWRKEGGDRIKVDAMRKWQSRPSARSISQRFTAPDSWTLLRQPAKTEVWTGADCVSIAG